MRQIKNKVLSDFNYELELIANQFNFKVLMVEEQLKAITSRSMIKKELYEYHLKNTSIDELRAFTQPKYTDGAFVYENLLYAVRVDVENNIVASYGKTPVNINISNDIGFFNNENGCNIILKNEIIHNNELIGYDNASFLLCNFNNQKSLLLENISVIKNPVENLNDGTYFYSIAIGETGYSLYAELNRDSLKSELSAQLKSVLIQSALLIIIIFIVSYFTILKLAFHIIQDLKQAARKDPLTGLANRKALWEKAGYLLEQSRRYNFKFAILYIDIDGFKLINDTYGHKAGDDLLIQIASRLSESVRSTDEVIRIGGDEFAIIISRIIEKEDCVKIAVQILNKFSNIFKIESDCLKIGASIGIAISKPGNESTVDHLLSEADLAMYEIKKSGKNSYKISNY
jgi:diguanylate cyclase (GGDEF)-like protein